MAKTKKQLAFFSLSFTPAVKVVQIDKFLIEQNWDNPLSRAKREVALAKAIKRAVNEASGFWDIQTVRLISEKPVPSTVTDGSLRALRRSQALSLMGCTDDQLKRRLPNVARLASTQQQRVLDGEDDDFAAEDEGNEFDILVETAMADVVTEQALEGVDGLAAKLTETLGGGGKEARVGETNWAAAATTMDDLLSSRTLDGILRLGVLVRQARGGGAGV